MWNVKCGMKGILQSKIRLYMALSAKILTIRLTIKALYVLEV